MFLYFFPVFNKHLFFEMMSANWQGKFAKKNFFLNLQASAKKFHQPSGTDVVRPGALSAAGAASRDGKGGALNTPGAATGKVLKNHLRQGPFCRCIW